MTSLIAIDPGKSGGIAYVGIDGIVQAENMPDGMTALADRLRALKEQLGHNRVVIEKVGQGYPGNSSKSMTTFARHCGHIEMAMYLLKFPTEQVGPKKWQQFVPGLSAIPRPAKPDMTGMSDSEEKEAQKRHKKALAVHTKARKDYIRDEMQRRYPHLKVTS